MEMGKASLAAARQRLGIHKGHHQYLLAARIDGDGGEQTLVVEAGQEAGAGFAQVSIGGGIGL